MSTGSLSFFLAPIPCYFSFRPIPHLGACSQATIHGISVIRGLNLLLVLVLAPRGFSPGSLIFSSLKKTTFPNEFDLESEGHRFVSRNRLPSVTQTKYSRRLQILGSFQRHLYYAPPNVLEITTVFFGMHTRHHLRL